MTKDDAYDLENKMQNLLYRGGVNSYLNGRQKTPLTPEQKEEIISIKIKLDEYYLKEFIDSLDTY